jgi:hypothetical protein
MIHLQSPLQQLRFTSATQAPEELAPTPCEIARKALSSDILGSNQIILLDLLKRLVYVCNRCLQHEVPSIDCF